MLVGAVLYHHRELAHAMSWKSKFVSVLAELNCLVFCLLKGVWFCLLLQSRLGLCKPELMKELAEVNCLLICLLMYWLVLSCVTIANWFISEVISWKSESVTGVV